MDGKVKLRAVQVHGEVVNEAVMKLNFEIYDYRALKVGLKLMQETTIGCALPACGKRLPGLVCRAMRVVRGAYGSIRRFERE